jgi:ATP-dependent RNA helicase DDX23/PRP28
MMNEIPAPPSIPAPPPPPPPPEDAPPPPPSEEPLSGRPTLLKKKGWAKKKDPPKIEELLKKKWEADAAKAKVRFIPKAERERIAKEAKLKEELDAKKRQEEATKPAAAASNGPARTGKPPVKPAGIPKEPASMRSQHHKDRDGHGNNRSHGKQSAAPKNSKDTKRTWEDMQEDMIKERYLGPDLSHSAFSANKKRKRTRDKFNFDWDANEDTTILNDPIYQNRTPSAIELKRKEKEELSIKAFGKHWSQKVRYFRQTFNCPAFRLFGHHIGWLG